MGPPTASAHILHLGRTLGNRRPSSRSKNKASPSATTPSVSAPLSEAAPPILIDPLHSMPSCWGEAYCDVSEQPVLRTVS